MRGDVHALRAPRTTRGHEQSGRRLAVIVQSDDLPLSTVVIAPTSTSGRPTSFRPTVTVGGLDTRVMVEQLVAVAPERLGPVVGHLTRNELEDVDEAMRLVLDLD